MSRIDFFLDTKGIFPPNIVHRSASVHERRSAVPEERSNIPQVTINNRSKSRKGVLPCPGKRWSHHQQTDSKLHILEWPLIFKFNVALCNSLVHFRSSQVMTSRGRPRRSSPALCTHAVAVGVEVGQIVIYFER